MKHLSSYKEIEEVCKKHKIKNWSIGRDGLVNVDGNVNLQFKDLEKLPLEFGEIRGDFSCMVNNLTNLKGAPRKVGGNFYCSHNKLTSLEGAPKEVGHGFYCNNNNNLTSLKGAPKKVGGYFYCHNNNLTSLKGAPKKVGGDFYCYNNNLTSLEGAPEEVGVSFDCGSNKLITLEGIPFDIKDLNCFNNPIYEIWKFINNVKYLQEFIEVYDVVRPGKVIILEYLNDVRKLMDKKPVKREEISDDWEILDI